jgi:hypothetical protein
MMRRPVPYIRRQTSPLVPSSRASTAPTSAADSTVGSRAGFFARSIPSSHGKGISSTSR